MKLTKEEKRILWIALNNAQNQGLYGLRQLLNTTRKIQVGELSSMQGDELTKSKMLKDWIKQTQEEYQIINELKSKLC